MRDLLNNCTSKALVVADELSIAVHTGATVDLKGVGRKVLAIINSGVPASGGLLDVVIHESDDSFSTDTSVLHTFDQIKAASLVEVTLTPTKRYIKAVATVTVAVVPASVVGIVYLERNIPSGI